MSNFEYFWCKKTRQDKYSHSILGLIARPNFCAVINKIPEPSAALTKDKPDSTAEMNWNCFPKQAVMNATSHVMVDINGSV